MSSVAAAVGSQPEASAAAAAVASSKPISVSEVMHWARLYLQPRKKQGSRANRAAVLIHFVWQQPAAGHHQGEGAGANAQHNNGRHSNIPLHSTRRTAALTAS
jgi:hypothetical protein